MAAHDYPAWEHKPHKLTITEVDRPLQVIRNFFDFAHLPQARELLWEFLKTSVTGSFNSSLSLQERNNLLYFYEQLEKLIEAAHILHQQHKKE